MNKWDEVERLLDRIRTAFNDPIKCLEWLHKPNSAFDNQSPMNLIESGKTHVLWNMIYMLESGDPY